MKKAVVSVTNDLATDQRVRRTIEVLRELNYQVTFVGRELPESMTVEGPFEVVRFKLWFRSGFLFYASYNLRLLFFLLFKSYDMYFSNDLDTLLPNFLVSRLKRKPLVYDSHEYFTGVPEIQHRPLVKKTWKIIERICLPGVKYFITVNDSIRELYRKEYGKNALVIRNIGDSNLPSDLKTKAELGLPEDKFLLINQGSGINVDRGMEEMFEALKLLDGVVLVLVGRGDVLPKLKAMAALDYLNDRIIFVPPQPYLEMLQYTLNADCGISLDKADNPNYKYSLPNKVFDYIKCRIPLVVSGVVEVKNIVERYQIGEVIADHQPQSIASEIEKIRAAGKEKYLPGLLKAASENSWEMEREKLKGMINGLKVEG